MQDLKEQARWIARQNGSVTAVARAVGVNHSNISRTRADLEYETLRHVTALSRSKETSPGAWIESLRVEARRAAMEERETSWLIEQWHRIRDERLPAALMQADKAARHGEREDEIQSRIIAGSLLTEMNGMDRELERRELDPRDFSPQGRRIQ